ncbi:hypothetical protein SELMODRAFT_418533 [Selaginella moellendorffii]|uniref:Uncharacterized protein n=1 Tax=Selaginella moellendorffii TaxID=88036 RepID=D8S607_SELML|nr:hypothetical protein SELMODRAFT_418533 [Selaginella moellendorffii]
MTRTIVFSASETCRSINDEVSEHTFLLGVRIWAAAKQYATSSLVSGDLRLQMPNRAGGDSSSSSSSKRSVRELQHRLYLSLQGFMLLGSRLAVTVLANVACYRIPNSGRCAFQESSGPSESRRTVCGLCSNFFTTCARTLARLRVEEDLQDQLLAERQVCVSHGSSTVVYESLAVTRHVTELVAGAPFSRYFPKSHCTRFQEAGEAVEREKQWKAAIDHPQGIAVRSNGVETKSKLEKGTCLNKADNVMFKQIVFELDFTVCKLKLMLSWVVVCDVWYVEPQINDALLGDRNELKLRKSLEILRPISKLTEEEQLNVVPLLVFQINMSVRKSGLSYGFFLHGPETPLDHAKKIKNKDKFKASMIRQQHVLSGHICGFQLSDRPKSCWMALKSVKK